MNLWVIQLLVSPAFERMQGGLLVHAEIEESESNIVSARYWVSDVEPMEWTLDHTVQNARQGVPSELEADVAKAILQPARSANVRIASRGDFGYVHPTRFQLKIMSGFNVCSLSWVHELPVEWSELHQSVQLLRELGEKLASTR